MPIGLKECTQLMSCGGDGVREGEWQLTGARIGGIFKFVEVVAMYRPRLTYVYIGL